MFGGYNPKNVLVVVIVSTALLFAIGASRHGESQSNGRFHLVVRHADRTDAYVIDSATGQVWSNSGASSETRKAFYDARLSQDLQSN